MDSFSYYPSFADQFNFQDSFHGYPSMNQSNVQDSFIYRPSSMDEYNVQMRTNRIGIGKQSLLGSDLNILNQPPRFQRTVVEPQLCNNLQRSSVFSSNINMEASQGRQNQVWGSHAHYPPKWVNNKYSISSSFTPLAPTYASIPVNRASQLGVSHLAPSYHQIQPGMTNIGTATIQRNQHLGTVGSYWKGRMVGYDVSSRPILQQAPRGTFDYYRKDVINPNGRMEIPLNLPQEMNWPSAPPKNCNNLDLSSRISTPSLYDPMYQNMGLAADPFLRVFNLKRMEKTSIGNSNSNNNNFTTKAAPNTSIGSIRSSCCSNNNTDNYSSSNNNNTTNFSIPAAINNNNCNTQGCNADTMSLPIQDQHQTSNQVNGTYDPPADPIPPLAEGGIVDTDNLMRNQQSNEEDEASDDFFLLDNLLNLEDFDGAFEIF